uniref:Coiled-coil domain-containing protein 39 n=1 Tax=Odontella aurita TaxID=265563 RepID=A0A6U6L7L3_9STRA|mmetsp:Transcript_6870/g.20566  ORF Transcript_6870/g.20566 Transcript_6870/m.20566 type:complete len:1024 (+) Transcript_6870:3900-6971(+)
MKGDLKSRMEEGKVSEEYQVELVGKDEATSASHATPKDDVTEPLTSKQTSKQTLPMDGSGVEKDATSEASRENGPNKSSRKKGDSPYKPRWGSSTANIESPSASEMREGTEDSLSSSDNSEPVDGRDTPDDDRGGRTEYRPRWGSSSNHHESNDIDDEDEEEAFVDDLPIFANESNKALHLESKRLEKQRDEAEKEAKSHNDRVEIMTEHLQNVKQEIDHTNGLVAAKKKEINTEDHLMALADRESGIGRSEIKKAEDSARVERERFKDLQTQLHRANEDTEKLKLALNWNQEELEQWATAATKKEEDNLALQKYTRADEMKIKELTLAIENLTKVSVEKQAQVENETTETQTRQVELDKTAESFKVQHTERRQLIKQWQETVETMRSRDKEINDISTKYADAKRVRDEQLKLLAKNREILALIDGDKDELVQEVDAAERLVQSKKQEQLAQQESLQSMADELEVLKHESSASATALQKLQTEQKGFENEYTRKREQLASFRNRCDEIKMRLDEEKKATLSREKATIQVEKFLAEREKELKQADVHLQVLKDQQFKDSQYLADLRREEGDLIAEIKNAQANQKNLSTTLKDLEVKRSKQQEIIYNAEFQLQQMERKVARGLGERSDEEKQQLQERIVELEEELDAHVQKRKSLLQQCKKVQVELLAWKRRRDTCFRHHQDIQGQISEVELEISSCEMSLKQITSSKEEATVSHDVIRLDVRRLRDTLRSRAEEVFALEERRDQLVLAMSERKEEINVHAEVQTAQLRAVEDERHKSAVELGRRGVALEKVKSKYEMLSKAHRSADDDGEEHSQVYYLIMAAQKREELLREGDELDANIRKKEKEMRSMEKTLAHLCERNTQFRLSFHKADMSSGPAKELRALEEKVRMSEQAIFEQKKELRSLENECEDSGRRLEGISQDTSQLEAENEHMEVARQQARKEVETHQQSLVRSRSQFSSLRGKYRESLPPVSEQLKSVQELNFRADVMEKSSTSILRMVLELGTEFPNLKKDITKDLGSEGIEV